MSLFSLLLTALMKRRNEEKKKQWNDKVSYLSKMSCPSLTKSMTSVFGSVTLHVQRERERDVNQP